MKRLYWLSAILAAGSLVGLPCVAQSPGGADDIDVSTLSDEELSASEELLHKAIESAYGPSIPTVLYEPPEPTEPPKEEAPEPAEAQPAAEPEESIEPTLRSDEELSASEELLHEAIESAYGPSIPTVLYEPPEPTEPPKEEAPEPPQAQPPAEPEESIAPTLRSDEELSASEELLHKAIESAYGPSIPTVLYEPPEKTDAAVAEEPSDTGEPAPEEPVVPRQALPDDLEKEPSIYDRPKELRMTPSERGPIAKRELPAMVFPPPVPEGIGAIDVDGLRPRGHRFLYASLAQAVAAHDLYTTLDMIAAGEVDPADEQLREHPPVLAAAEQGDAHIMNALWDSGVVRQATDTFGNQALHLAAAANRVYMIRMLERRGQNIMSRNEQGYTPLHVAAEHGSLDAIETLVALGANMAAQAVPNVYSPPLLIAGRAKQWEATALLRRLGPDFGIHEAAALGDIGAMQSMLRLRPARINEENHLGQTPLFSATAADQYDMVLFLLQNRADVHAITRNGNSAFNQSLTLPTFDIAELLLIAGARVDGIGGAQIRDPLLHRAAREGNLRVLDFLLDHGAAIEVTDHKGETAMSAAAETGQCGSIARLAARGANTNHHGDDARTPLHIAARLGLDGTVACLLDNGADVEARARLRFTALHTATHADHPAVVEVLIQHGAVVSLRDLYGRTPLHIAAMLGHLDIARTLAAAGGKIVARDRGRNVPLHLAAESGQRRMVDWLADSGAAVDAVNREHRTPLALAVENDRFALARHLVILGAQLEARDRRGQGLVHLAAGLQRSLMLEWLLFMGLDPAVPDQDGQTPLHVASGEGSAAVLGLLLAQGVDVDPLDRDGRTPLHVAALRGEAEPVTMLLRAGATSDLPDSDGRLPLHLCALAGNLEAAMPLFERDHDPNRPGKDGNTLIHCAVIGGDLEFLRYAIRKGGEFAARNAKGQTPIVSPRHP